MRSCLPLLVKPVFSYAFSQVSAVSRSRLCGTGLHRMIIWQKICAAFVLLPEIPTSLGVILSAKKSMIFSNFTVLSGNLLPLPAKIPVLCFRFMPAKMTACAIMLPTVSVALSILCRKGSPCLLCGSATVSIPVTFAAPKGKSCWRI